MPDRYTYEEVEAMKDYILSKYGITAEPKIGIICGSGLGSMGDSIENPIAVDYRAIPNFPIPTAEGHIGRFIFGKLANIDVVCMQGRFHYYEGHTMQTCVMPVQLMKLLGIKYLIASNAAGGVNQNFRVGDIMIHKDFINLMGLAGIGPLIGPLEKRFGPDRFFPVSRAFDPQLLNDVKNICKNELKMNNIQEGVYTCVGGPNYETIAEVKLLALFGVDAVGMSTVAEIVTAKHCGLQCFAFSVITNICGNSYEQGNEPTSEHVLEAANAQENDLNIFIRRIVDHIGQTYL